MYARASLARSEVAFLCAVVSCSDCSRAKARLFDFGPLRFRPILATLCLLFCLLPSLFVDILARAHIWRFSFFDWTDCRLASIFEPSSSRIHILLEGGIRNRPYDGHVQHRCLRPLLGRANGFVFAGFGNACPVDDSTIKMRHCVAGARCRALRVITVRRNVFNRHVEVT